MAHIKANLLFYPGEKKDGTPVFFTSGYRPAFKFKDNDEFNSGEIKFIGKDRIESGETVEGDITLLHPELVKEYLKVGNTFSFQEGTILAGKGEILKVYQ